MSQRKPTDWIGECIRTVATLLIGCGLIAFFVAVPKDRERSFSPNSDNDGYLLEPRFKTDNAIGATAHAVEWIAKQHSRPLVGNAIWIGLALWVIGSMRRTRIAIERLADELAPIPIEEPVADENSLARRAGQAVGTKKG